MDNLLSLKLKTGVSQTQSEKDQIEEIIKLIAEMNLPDFEPLLDENLNKDRHEELYLGKYRSLAILQELFYAFKESGDTEIEVEQGYCRVGCFENCSVVNLVGNKSRKNFAFVLEKENGLISNFHHCSLYENKERVAKKVDLGLYERIKNKQRKINGEPPLTKKELDRMDWGINMLYEKYAQKSESEDDK